MKETNKIAQKTKEKGMKDSRIKDSRTNEKNTEENKLTLDIVLQMVF